MREHYKNIACVMRTRGRVGEVVVVATGGLPSLMHEGLEVCVVPPELKEPRFTTVVSCRDDGDAQVIRLDGFTTIAEAEKLKGRYILARENDLPAGFAFMDATRLIGREVYDATLGFLGSIVDIMFGPIQATWAVDGPYGEVLIPAVSEIVGDVAPEGVIELNLPKGLVGDAHD